MGKIVTLLLRYFLNAPVPSWFLRVKTYVQWQVNSLGAKNVIILLPFTMHLIYSLHGISASARQNCSEDNKIIMFNRIFSHGMFL